MEDLLAYYRLYFLDGDSSHILECREFEALDDDAAIRLADSWQALGPMELWCRDRRIQRWNSRPRAEVELPPR